MKLVRQNCGKRYWKGLYLAKQMKIEVIGETFTSIDANIKIAMLAIRGCAQSPFYPSTSKPSLSIRWGGSMLSIRGSKKKSENIAHQNFTTNGRTFFFLKKMEKKAVRKKWMRKP